MVGNIIPQRLKTANQIGQERAATVYYESSATGGYDIVKDKGRRKNPRTGKSAEHVNYNQRHRDKAQGTIYDIIRNDIVAQWAFNKFLDYTTVHYFQSSTGDQVLDDDIEWIVEEWSLPENCDISRRFSLDDNIRLFASGKALDGDGAIGLLNNLKLQGIEGDNIRTPDGKVSGQIPEAAKKAIQGIVFDEYGAALQYVICRKSERPNHYDFSTLADANSVIFDGNFFRFDQPRGVPVFNAAANTAQDIKEIDEYQLIKVKNHAMMAVAFKSDAVNSGFSEAPLANGVAGQAGTTATSGPKYEFEMDSGLKMELAQGDSVDMLESKTPSREYKEFAELMMRKFLLTFEVPFEFFNPMNASYSVMKHVRAEFKFGIQRFEMKNRNVRYRILKWILPELLRRNGVKLPEKFADNKIFRFLNWLPQAEPWLEEDREVSAALARIDGGLSNHEIEARRRGSDAFDILRGSSRVQSYIRTAGLVLSVGQPGAALWNSDKLNKTNITVSGGAVEPPPSVTPPAGNTSQGANNE